MAVIDRHIDSFVMAPRVKLGPMLLSSPAMLAPLAGYSDSAMRRISRHYGAAMVFSEMLSG